MKKLFLILNIIVFVLAAIALFGCGAGCEQKNTLVMEPRFKYNFATPFLRTPPGGDDTVWVTYAPANYKRHTFYTDTTWLPDPMARDKWQIVGQDTIWSSNPDPCVIVRDTIWP